LACAISALGAPPIKACLAQAKEFGGSDGRCTLIGGGQANAVYAASYNTALLRAAAELAPDGVEVELYEQAGVLASEEIADNKAVNQGSGTIAGFPALPAGSPIDIRMSVDDEGLLRLCAAEPASGKTLDIQVSVSVLSHAEVAEATEVVAGLTVSG